MIKNQRQYRVTRAQLERFQGLLEDLSTRPYDGQDDLLRKLESDAVEAQVIDLNAELSEYDSLRSGRTDVGRLESLDELPRLLIRTRIASGLTQRDLAERLGMHEQQIQRYEADDWSTANLSRLIETANALGIVVSSSLTASVPEQSGPQRLTQQLQRVGLDPAFVRLRLAPGGADHTEGLGAMLDFAARVHRIYGWSPSDILAEKDLAIELPVAVGFKLPKRANEGRLRAYTVYAHYLALLALAAAPSLEPRPIPSTPSDFRLAVLKQAGKVDFEAVLSFVWDLGIPVVPLADPGAFHAVLWRSSGRNAIVLKQQNRTPSRWVFDLLHEVEHAAESPTTEEYAVVDEDPAAGDEAEVAANRFAGDVLLDGRAEELTAECVTEARGRIELLKTVVPRVAERHEVETGDLANYVAYRLSLQGQNWWGAATNLQRTGPDPWTKARDEFFKRSDVGKLNPLDRDLLAQAMTE